MTIDILDPDNDDFHANYTLEFVTDNEPPEDFVSPILASISGVVPDYENDFSVVKAGLVFDGAYSGSGSAEYLGDKYDMTVTAPDSGIRSYTEDNFHNMVLAFELEYISGFTQGDLLIKLKGENDIYSEYDIGIHLKGDGDIFISLHRPDTESTMIERETDLFVSGMDAVEVMIITQDSNIALLLDSEIIAAFEDEVYRPAFGAGPVLFELNNSGSNEEVECRFDNLKIWDLDQ
ncbi:MAG: hypothetical protein JW874_00760 [Spirochaetales bacterium]|nr:hypothetical protein [Spirochaetales bacterium]